MKQGERTRRNIIRASSKLFYQKGYANTAISDIVDETGLSKGNITYHFKSKDDILNAVLEYRARLSVDGFTKWERASDTPQECLNRYVESLVTSRSELTRFGCRNGSLASELGKSGPRVGQNVFDTTLDWLSKQFESSGASGALASELAIELMIRGQGICLLAQAYNDEDLFSREVGKLMAWLESTNRDLRGHARLMDDGDVATKNVAL